MILQILFVLFLGLKLSEIIAWSYWIVFTPIFLIVFRWLASEIFKESCKSRATWAVDLKKWLNN